MHWDRPLNFDDTFHRHVYNPLDDTFHGHVHNLLDHFFHRHVHNPFHYLPLHRLDNLLRALHLLHDSLDHRRLRLRLDDERCDLLRRWQMTLLNVLGRSHCIHLRGSRKDRRVSR